MIELENEIKEETKPFNQNTSNVLLNDEEFKNPDNIVFSCRNVDLYYDNGDKHSLKNINIDILKNKVTAFIGPSGCGKSTLLRCFDRMNDLIDGCKITHQHNFIKN